jgi:phage tail sheath protein FI
MTIKKLSIEDTIKEYTNENGFSWGTNTVIRSLAPEVVGYDLHVNGGTFTIERWDSHSPKPTSQEIRDEYIRQQTIAECLIYFKENSGFRGLIKKLFR